MIAVATEDQVATGEMTAEAVVVETEAAVVEITVVAEEGDRM
jgi:hypothetical protein